MLFDQTIRKELGRNFAATFIVLLSIVMTIVMIRTLGYATKGVVNPADTILFMTFTVLGYAPVVLVLALFLAMVATLNRMYQDSEMVIWFAAGRGLWGFVRPVLRFGFPIIISTWLLSMWLWPWANQQVIVLREQFAQRSNIERVSPGQFQASSDGKLVFYIDETQTNDKGLPTVIKNVFLSQLSAGKESIAMAPLARVEKREAGEYLLLQQGQLIEKNAESGRLTTVDFTELSVLVQASPDAGFDGEAAGRPRAQSSKQLLQEWAAPQQGEFFWRLGLGLTAFVLVFWALAATYVNPRRAKSINVFFSILAFALYYNLLGLGQNWIAKERIGFVTAMFAIHGSMLVLGLVWLTLRHTQWSWSLRTQTVTERNPPQVSKGVSP